jgi:hypothetical protein
MAVSRVYESPRVTKPYRDEEWAAIRCAALAVDATCSGTTSGSPWAASRRLSRSTIATSRMEHRGARTDETAARGGLLWRLKATDRAGRARALRPGQVVSRRAAAALGARLLLARRRRAGLAQSGARSPRRSPDGRRGRTPSAFLRALRDASSSTDEHVLAGYEDVWYYLWRERRLPVNVDPFDARLDDELERVRLRRVFDRGLDDAGRLHPPARAGRGRHGALAHRAVVSSRRAVVPGARRLADGIPFAARFRCPG